MHAAKILPVPGMAAQTSPALPASEPDHSRLWALLVQLPSLLESAGCERMLRCHNHACGEVLALH